MKTIGSRMLVCACALFCLPLFLRCPPAAAAAVQDLIGHYTGSWTNITFGSTGTAVVDIQVNGAAAAVVFDFNGFVFGMGDPPVMSVPGAVQGNAIIINSRDVGLFGDVTGTIDAQNATLQLSLTNIPGGYITHVSVTGSFATGKLNSTYTVDFNGPPSPTNPANGVIVLAAPVPFSIVAAVLSGNSFVLQWTGGKSPYQVESCADLAHPLWSNVGSPTVNTSMSMPAATSGTAFFRVRGQ